jgi:hypothetical protein
MTLRKMAALAGFTTLVGCAVVPPAPAIHDAPKPDLTEAQAREIYKKTSPVGAMALVKLAFLSEYCRALVNQVPQAPLKVEMRPAEVKGLPSGAYAYEFNYTGVPKQGPAVPSYCGRLTVSGPVDGGEAVGGQYQSMTMLLTKTSALAGRYAALPPEQQAANLEATHREMKVIAHEFREGVLGSLMKQPYLPDGRLNMIGTTVSPPVPGLYESPFSELLDKRIERLRRDLAEVDEAYPIVPPGSSLAP